MFFTDEEIRILEEALALWVHQTREDLSGLELSTTQEWSLERAERIRQGLAAALDDRPWFDIAPQRMPPAEDAMS